MDLSNVIIFAADSNVFLELCKAVLVLIYDIIEKNKSFLTLLLLKVTNVEIIPLPAITALGVSLTSLFFCLEMFSQMAQFRVERIEDAIRIAMKFIVAKIIIENSVGIVKGIFKMFHTVSNTYISETMDFIGQTVNSITLAEEGGGFMDIGFIMAFVGYTGVAIVILVTFIKIAITFVGVSFEIGIHQAVAPIALSTLCNDLARPTGIAFIKSFSATCLQLVVMTAIFHVFTDIMTNFLMLKDFKAEDLGIFKGLVEFIMPIILLMALNKAIKSASEITKRMFGA